MSAPGRKLPVTKGSYRPKVDSHEGQLSADFGLPFFRGVVHLSMFEDGEFHRLDW
jgi:hypothetical protein